MRVGNRREVFGGLRLHCGNHRLHIIVRQHLLMMTILVIETSSGETGKNTDRPANLIFTTS